MDLQPGLMVTDNVRLHRQIGEGGMGTIWVAEHLALETEVAVKFMAPELATHPDAVARFTREAKAAARLRSPHVVKVFDYGLVDGGVPYMTMELLEGENLEARISRGGRLRLDETVQVVTQLSKAIAEAHALGVVHRDIKPENVFLMDCNGDFFIKVLDFGIAKQATGKSSVGVTSSGTTIGTPIYMSPEQILSAKDVDYRCDLWSLAIVAYYCLTGRVPFEGETFGAVCIAIDRGRMRLPSTLRSEVPAAVDEWFVKALARDVNERFRSAREMADAFVAAIRGAVPSRSMSMALTVPFFGRKASRVAPHTLVGAAISASARRSVRKHASTIASVATMMVLALCSMSLGRVWFGRDAEPVLHAAPALAYVEPAATHAVTPPIAAPSPNDMARMDARMKIADIPLKAAELRAHAQAPAERVSPAANVVAAARPMLRTATAWSRAQPVEERPPQTLATTAHPAPPATEAPDIEVGTSSPVEPFAPHTRTTPDLDAGTHDAGPAAAPPETTSSPSSDNGLAVGDTPVL
jgi:serine/threonine-protein kinase